MKPFIFFIKLTLVVLTLMFIWGNSMMPGELSSKESETMLEVLEPVVEPVVEELQERGYEVTEIFLVRKMAHFTEFMILGALMFLLFVKPDGRSRYILPSMLCLGAAMIDEGIQIFAMERGPALRDVGIDFCGSLIGILATALVVLIVYSILTPRPR